MPSWLYLSEYKGAPLPKEMLVDLGEGRSKWYVERALEERARQAKEAGDGR
jgi:hypothetical protein